MKMIEPRPFLYICGMQALEVRNAPSRWIDSSFFQSVEREVLDLVDDLDAGVGDQHVDAAPLLRRRSATPSLTCFSSVTSIATPIALPGPLAVSFSAVSLAAASSLRSAIATRAPSSTIAFGDAFADAAGGAGDDSDLVLQFHGGSRLLG